jgi:hypothetical protein
MLIKLLPDQISKFWDIIKYAVDQSVPPIAGEHPNRLNNILMSALDGSIDVWASVDKSRGGNRFEGVVLTEILFDRPSKTKNLLIYCLYGYDDVDKHSWMTGLKTIVKYAASKGCNQIVAYTEVPYIIELVKNLGGDTKFTFISFNVNQIIKKFNDLNGGLDAS